MNLYQMKSILYIIFSSLVVFLSFTSCQSKKGAEESNTNKIVFKSFTTSDSIDFNDNDGYLDKLKIRVEVELPTYYLNATESKKLYSIFISTVLGIDSTTVEPQKAINSFLTNYKDKLCGMSNVEEDASLRDEDLDNHKHPLILNSSIKVYHVFNEDNILSVCKEKTSQYNDESASSEQQYYNFDLNKMKIIELNDLFSEESIAKINELLKDKLIEQNNVKNEDELIELGYFNLDNLFASNNFFINKKGLTWNFLPLEIGCFNTGETKIFLSYEILSPLIISDSTILSNYINKKS